MIKLPWEVVSCAIEMRHRGADSVPCNVRCRQLNGRLMSQFTPVIHRQQGKDSNALS